MAVDGVRINELPSYLTFTTELANDDKIPYYLAEFDKTVWMNVSTFRTWILSGGSGTIAPVVVGKNIIHDVTSAEAGGITVSIPSLAGKTFELSLEGRPLKTNQYEILAAGGFRITITDYVLVEGQRFLISPYDLAIVGGDGSANATSLVSGNANITTDYTYNAVNDRNKLIQLRGGSTTLRFTLPRISDVPANTLIIIEALIGNQKQHSIETQEGQYIYMNNDTYTVIYIGPGEKVWLLVTEDGFYVINDFDKIYQDLLNPYPSFKSTDTFNETTLDGSIKQRADNPRQWAEIQKLGASVVDEATWQTPSLTINAGTDFEQVVPNPYKGCFSRGDGTSTYRLPDFTNSTIRGLKNFDTERAVNVGGGFQKGGTEQHNHVEAPYDKAGAKASDLGGGQTPGSTDSANGASEYRVGGMTDAMWESARIKPFGIRETRMDNIGMYWKIKK